MSLTARIIKNEGFQIVGVKKEMTSENYQGMSQVPAFWQEITETEKITELMPLMNQAPFGLVGMSVYNIDSADPRKFDYYIGCATSKEVPATLASYQVPAATWAVFDCKNNTEMNQILPRIVTEWQVTSDYQLVNEGYETGNMSALLPDIELYPDQSGAVEIWIAVKPKTLK